MNPRRAEGLGALEPRDDQPLGVRERAQETDLGHLAEVAEHGRQAHLRQQRLPDLRVPLHLRRHALVRQAVVADQRAEQARRPACRAGAWPARTPRSSPAPGPGAAPRRRASQPLVIQWKIACWRSSLATGCALRRRSRCDQPSRLWYLTAWKARRLASISVYQRANARIVPRPQPPSALTYSAKWNRCVPMRATRGSAANAARRVSTSPQLRGEREREQRRIVLGRPALVRDLDDAVHDPAAVELQAAPDGLRVLARELALAWRSSCRPPLRGSGSDRGASSRRRRTRSRPRCCGTCDVPGIDADCGVLFVVEPLVQVRHGHAPSLRSATCGRRGGGGDGGDSNPATSPLFRR